MTRYVLKKNQQMAPSILWTNQMFKVPKALKWAFFFCNEIKAEFILRNHFIFANRKNRTGTIKTKVLLCTVWFYKLIML